MHEMSIARSLVVQVIDLTRDQPGQSLSSVRVRVGELAGVEPQLLLAACEMLAEESAIANTRWEILSQPLLASCELCGETIEIRGFCFACNHCGSTSVRVTSGDAVILEQITMVAMQAAAEDRER